VRRAASLTWTRIVPQYRAILNAAASLSTVLDRHMEARSP
jgi:hypothetical protein